jgi:hypothetical protein
MSRESTHRDLIFLKLFLKAKVGEVSEEEARYFRDHPDQIDEKNNLEKHRIAVLLGLGLAIVIILTMYGIL